MDGPTRPLSHWRGKVTVLAFWDANCSHCRQAMPEVNEIARAFADNSNVIVIANSINDSIHETKTRDAIADLSLDSMLHAFSGNGVHDEAYLAFRGTEVPLYVVIDKGGLIRFGGDDIEALRAAVIYAMSSP